MKKLVLFGLIIAGAARAASSAPATTAPTRPRSRRTGISSKSTATSLTCPPTLRTAALYSQEIDANYNNVGPPIIDLFNCDAFTAKARR